MLRSFQRSSLIALAFLALVGGARAQGSDNCATPAAIAGTGSFVYSALAATTGAQGQTEAACNFFGSTAIEQDVWFTWTAPSTGFVYISLCAGTSTAFDTKVAVYPGTACPGAGSALACNDDSCNFISELGFNCTLGSSYVIQIGSFPGSGGTSGAFNLTIGPPPPPTPPCTSTGPDVIVGELIDTINAAPVGGIDALALGTYSCNIGNVQLNWVSNNANHPVIAQNLYRYKVIAGAGRMEQVGMSWLKHGFTALQDNLCCPTCTASPVGSRLGIGCADPYTAGLNGSQGGLGPHWQVDAQTGIFTYPPANPAWAGTVARRLQVAVADCEVTGAPSAARYFGEGQYVTRDDALNNNQNNNSSWREVTVTSPGAGNFDFALFGPTFRTQSAIQAWGLVEAGVTMNQVTGGGKLIVASKATALGGGQYHYEFAVYNMNSNRHVGSFSVPVPAGTVVSNIGFHDVPYHSGDGNGSVNYSGVDWPGALAGGAVSWACETQAVNNNANAIRWGTTYNFRFDANVPPQAGTLTLGLWVPGTPTSVTTTGDVPGVSTFTAYCAGDGVDPQVTTPCPCGNTGAAGNGCASSFNASGAHLSAHGAVATDDVVLDGTGMNPTGNCIFLKGDANVPAGLVFGDGLRCLDGNLIRLRTKTLSGGAASFPDSTDTITLSARGATPVGSGLTGYYDAYYRNATVAFCPPETFNASNGFRVTW
ncbi:MAG: hypothetical protein HZA53_19575 [Planctomycetes bacterium]|nr:hypothetical protein [Planctomycetota bacterium]